MVLEVEYANQKDVLMEEQRNVELDVNGEITTELKCHKVKLKI